MESLFFDTLSESRNKFRAQTQTVGSNGPIRKAQETEIVAKSLLEIEAHAKNPVGILNIIRYFEYSQSQADTLLAAVHIPRA